MATTKEVHTKKAPLQRDANTFIMKDAFYPTMEKALSNKTNVNTFVKYVENYRNKNIEILSRIYPHKLLIFDRNGEDANIIFRTCGIDRKTVMPVIKEARKAVLLDQIKSDENADVVTILVFMMKYFYNDKKVLHAVYMYYAYSIWHLVYHKFFSNFNPPEEVVSYTINELNNKYTAKKLGSIDLALEEIMNLVAVWAEDRLERASDKDIIEIIQGIRTRINNLNKNIANKIHANMKAGNRIFSSVETNAETGELITDRESNSGRISVLAAEYTTKFFSTGMSQEIANLAASMSQVSQKEVQTAITLIHTDGDIRGVRKFYDCIFYAFFSYYPQYTEADIKSQKFLAAADAIYKKGNSNDKNVLTIKQLSHKWLEKGSRNYRVSNSAATKNSFRKAIYWYFVLAVAFHK